MKQIEQIKILIDQVQLWTKDTFDSISDNRSPMIPPRRKMYDGPQDPAIFVQNGQEFLNYYLELCGLKANESIIEIGSGMGRKAIPLTGYLSDSGSYIGFEINQDGVNWCQQEITTRYPNFRFEQIDVYNGRYNPQGSYMASRYTFPQPDHSADFVVLASVFTHMFIEDIAHYLAEIQRMLKPASGRCLISYFILNDAVRQLINEGASGLTFQYQRDGYSIERAARPEDAVAYEEKLIQDLYTECGLKIIKTYHGSWCGRSDFVSYQDLVLAVPSAD